jgi:hypothetical protein
MDEDSNDPEEYTVEAIRSKRKTKSGTYEYFIKWAGYPESDNTWEPLENLKCPELIQQFNESAANERRRKKADRGTSQQPASKRLRREASSLSGSTQGSEDTVNDDHNSLFAEDDDDDYEDDIHGSTSKRKNKTTNNRETHQANDEASLKGFERGLPIERIVNACMGDDNKLYFFIEWQGRSGLEMVEADELEKNGSYELCRWYRERLYWEPKEKQSTVAQ